ncbi:MAG: ABC transporter ATP-binding protein [Rhizobiales bacterium]|nr:ABC transporter ATP-binding protein [Hyphomicrobiales bacterium]
MNIIELRELTKSFPGAGRVVDNVTLNIREGEFVTLLGPSGCGKTTTLRLIAGFEYPDRGSVRVSGQDVTELAPYHRPVNTVFQDYALFPHMSVEQNVGYGMWIARAPRAEIAARVIEALRMVGLQEKAKARPAELSGGQKQRVALARAIIRRPKVLLLDEPLSALDAKLREAMQVELRHLHQKLGITFLLVTHDQTEALVMSDRILIMERGRVVQDGTPPDLYERPASPYVANFLGTSNLLRANVAGQDGDVLAVEAGPIRLRVRMSRRFEKTEKVTLAIRPEKSALMTNARPDPGRAVISGRIIDHLFQGDVLRTSVDIGLDTPFLIDTQLASSGASQRLPPTGSEAQISIDEASIIIFPGWSGS